MSASLPDVRLRIGSGIGLHVAAAEVHLSPTQQAYLLLLAHAQGEGIRRADVISLLWGEEEGRSTRHRVRQLSYGLNRKVGGVLVEPMGELLRLADDVTVEWTLEPYGASLPSPTPAFDDHVGEIREARERGAALGAVRQLDSARLADVPDEVLRVLGEGHRTPGSWRDLLWALLRTGRVREAEFELRRILGDDLPGEGLPTARRMAAEPDRILSLAAAGGDPAIPLLGRDEDVRRINELMVSGARSVLVTGVRGVGRSRILGQAVATLLSNQDDVVILGASGVAFERHAPFAGLGQLLNDELLIQAFTELGQPETEVIRRALPVQFETTESHVLAQLGGPGSYLRVAQAVTELFRRAFGNAEVLLVIDDLDQLDRSSLEVVSRLSTVCDARLLATWCTEGETTQNELLFRFQGMRPEVLPLRDLALGHAIRLSQAVAPDLGLREAEDIARLSGGRPGRIVELIRALKGSPILSGPMGPSLDELLRRRIRELSDVEQQVLVYMAVNGGRMDVATLGALLGAGILETAGHLRSLEAAGLARLEGNRAAVVPGLLTGFVLRELPPPARQETHAAIAARLIKHPDRVDPGSIGHHLLESGRPVEAAAWFRKAGFAARDRTAYAEAILYLEKGLASDDQPDPHVAKELGSLHAGMGDFRQSIHWYGRARMGYVDRGDAVGDVEAVLEESMVRLEATEKPAPLFVVVKEQLARAEFIGDSRLVAKALEGLFQLADYTHDLGEVRSAESSLRYHLARSPECPKLAFSGARLTYLGEPALGLVLARRAYLESRTTPANQLIALNRLLLARWVTGLVGTSRGAVLIRSAARIAKGAGDLPTRFSMLANAASWYMDREEWDRASLSLDSAEQLTDGLSAQQASFLAVNRAILAIRQGDALAAVPHLDTLDDLPDSPRASAQILATAIRVIVRLEQGRLSEALQAGSELARVDLGFPFSSNLSLVAEAMSELLRRSGKGNESVAFLGKALRMMGRHNVPCANQLRRRLSAWAG